MNNMADTQSRKGRSQALVRGAWVAALAVGLAGCQLAPKGQAPAAAKGVSGVVLDVYEFATRVSNGRAEIVVGQSSGGRLLRYAIDGRNILYRLPQPDPAKVRPGRHIRVLAGRFDIGPEKNPTHPIPRREVLWRGPWRLKQVGPLAVEITSQKCPATGVQIKRLFRLDADSSHLLVRQTMTNVSDHETRWCFWSRTLAKGGGIAIVPLNPKSKFPHGFARYLWGEERKKLGKDLLVADPSEPRIKVVGDLVTLEAVGDTSLKIGCDSDGEWMAYARGGLLFVKRFRYFPGATYSDALGFSVAVYLTGDMCELEPISPEAVLKPGESYTYDEEWWLFDYPDANKRPLDLAAIKKLVAERTRLGE